jgi:hypothetical protein
MPVSEAFGWMLEQMVALAANPEKWFNEGGPIGLGGDDPDYDPAFDEATHVEPPPGYENLPFHEGV